MALRTGCLAAGAAIVALSSGSADASVLVGDVASSTDQTGATFSVEGLYEYQGDNIGFFTLSISNVTEPGIGGYLTGFLFNVDSLDPAFSLSLMSAPSEFWLDIAGSNAAPLGGPFMGGAATYGSWQGIGPWDVGLGAGAVGTFVFEFEASDASSLSAMDIGIGSPAHNFVVRFRGLNNGGSDKVPAGAPFEVPAPGGAVLLAGLATIAVLRRRR